VDDARWIEWELQMIVNVLGLSNSLLYPLVVVVVDLAVTK